MGRLTWMVSAAAVLAAICSAPAAAQQAPLPDGVIAQVGDEPIAERDFRHLLSTAVRSPPLDAPRFRRCVAAGVRRLRELGRKPDRLALRRRCRARYESVRDQVTLFLIQALWVRQEAAAQGITVRPERVRRSFERQKDAAFHSERDYRRFLRESGLTEADVLARVELDILQRLLTGQVVASVPEVTREDVDRFYAAHPRRYRGVPPARARRTIRGALTAARRQRAIDRYVRDFRSRYRAITVCADGYVIAECSNAQRR